MVAMGLTCVYVFVKLHMKSPQTVQPLDRQDLIQRITDSAPCEGPSTCILSHPLHTNPLLVYYSNPDHTTHHRLRPL